MVYKLWWPLIINSVLDLIKYNTCKKLYIEVFSPYITLWSHRRLHFLFLLCLSFIVLQPYTGHWGLFLNISGPLDQLLSSLESSHTHPTSSSHGSLLPQLKRHPLGDASKWKQFYCPGAFPIILPSFIFSKALALIFSFICLFPH